ncbi:kinase-like domain-containing protein [Paraphoma chrysanthemicola]|nr:kinase-like domain-containing protein [Paraphoma chrysanthemicola]
MLSIEHGVDYEDVEEAKLPYVHVRNLGHGQSGNVEEVKDELTGHVYARKTIRIVGPSRERAERMRVFRNEIGIIRGLESHRHIISVHATYATKRYFGILLQPVASEGDLEDFLTEFRESSNEADIHQLLSARAAGVTTILSAFGCLVSGLAFMHGKRIRHKDIKPRNILVHEGRMLYTDFGYSFDSNGFTRTTTEGLHGFLTRRYSAPEVIKCEPRNSKSDVFSLGCVFLEMLSALTQSLTCNEEQLYSDVLDSVHEELRALNVPFRLAILPRLITSMTLQDQKDRPTARQICDLTTCHVNLSCIECRAKPPPNEVSGQETCNAPADLLGQVVTADIPADIKNISGLRYYTRWTWSEAYRRHYMYLMEQNHIVDTFWSPQDISVSSLGSQLAGSVAKEIEPAQERIDDKSSDANMAPTTPINVKDTITFQGTPNVGWYEQLESRYRMRTRDEAHRFFVKGRVFAMLWSETASPTMIGNRTALTVGRFGEGVYSQIRRFVVMRVNKQKHFVYACAITTYRHQGVLTPGCAASEHAVVYLKNTQPTYLPGELEKGMRKEPIEITPCDSTETLTPTSRLRFGKHHSIEWNVKVREVGQVSAHDMSKLLDYYKEEMSNGFDDDDDLLKQGEDNAIDPTPSQRSDQRHTNFR